MDAAIIVPTDFLKTHAATRRIHMALAHRVLDPSDQTYRAFYRQRFDRNDHVYAGATERRDAQSFVILDNSLMENGHVALTLQDLLQAAHIIEADEIILPDVFRDFEANNESIADAFNTIRIYDINEPAATKKFRIAGVVQGATPDELIYSYQLLTRSMDTVCIPKVVDTIWPDDGRLGFIFELEKRNLLRPFLETRSPRLHRHSLHLLGVWTYPFEVWLIERAFPGIFRSVDSALPFHAGIAEHVFHNLYGQTVKNNGGATTTYTKAKRPDNYLDIRRVDLTENQLYTISCNIDIFDSYAGGLHNNGSDRLLYNQTTPDKPGQAIANTTRPGTQEVRPSAKRGRPRKYG